MRLPILYLTHLPGQPTSLSLTGAAATPLTAFDVHVTSPLQEQTLEKAVSTLGHALQGTVKHKLSSHLSACLSVGIEFIPLVAETLGGHADDTIFTIRTLGQLMDREPPLLIPPSASGTSSIESPLPSGVAMPACGCISFP